MFITYWKDIVWDHLKAFSFFFFLYPLRLSEIWLLSIVVQIFKYFHTWYFLWRYHYSQTTYSQCFDHKTTFYLTRPELGDIQKNWRKIYCLQFPLKTRTFPAVLKINLRSTPAKLVPPWVEGGVFIEFFHNRVLFKRRQSLKFHPSCAWL